MRYTFTQDFDRESLALVRDIGGSGGFVWGWNFGSRVLNLGLGKKENPRISAAMVDAARVETRSPQTLLC